MIGIQHRSEHDGRDGATVNAGAAFTATIGGDKGVIVVFGLLNDAFERTGFDAFTASGAFLLINDGGHGGLL